MDWENLMRKKKRTEMVVYISGPITGHPDYKERFNEAAEILERRGYGVINPASMDLVLHKNATHSDFMRISFELLDMADAILMLPGWRNSCGASQEYGYAVAKKKIIREATTLEEI